MEVGPADDGKIAMHALKMACANIVYEKACSTDEALYLVVETGLGPHCKVDGDAQMS